MEEEEVGCKESGCDNPVHAKGLCEMHYMRLYRRAKRTTHEDDVLGRKRVGAKLDAFDEIVAEFHSSDLISLQERAFMMKISGRIHRLKGDERYAAADDMLEEGAGNQIDCEISEGVLPPPPATVEVSATAPKIPAQSALAVRR